MRPKLAIVVMTSAAIANATPIAARSVPPTAHNGHDADKTTAPKRSLRPFIPLNFPAENARRAAGIAPYMYPLRTKVVFIVARASAL